MSPTSTVIMSSQTDDGTHDKIPDAMLVIFQRIPWIQECESGSFWLPFFIRNRTQRAKPACNRNYVGHSLFSIGYTCLHFVIVHSDCDYIASIWCTHQPCKMKLVCFITIQFRIIAHIGRPLTICLFSRAVKLEKVFAELNQP